MFIIEFATEMYDFVASLQSIGSRLTHLAVYEIDGAAFEDIIPEDTFPVAKILSSCPNLVSFSVIQQDAYDFNLLPMATWSNMTTLTISSGATLTRDHIISICQRFPSLKKLDLCPCDSIESALMIPRFCPTLKSVEIDIQDSAVGVIYSDCSIGHQEELTVTKLSVLIDWTWDDMFERTATLIQQHHTTLEDIQWIIAPAHDHQGFYSIQYPRLKKLSVNFGGWWILLNAPIVEDLFLASPSIIDNPQVLDTIPPNLKALELRLNEGPMPVNRDTIEQYLYRVSQQCHLQELAIHFDNLYNLFRTRGAITRFNTLQCLVVGFDDGWDHNEMERFFDAVVIGCPDLSSLEISCGNSPSTYSINALKQLRHLEQMTFSIEDTDGYDSFWNAIRTFSHLKRIRIYPADQVNHAEIRRLKEQRRDMKIIVDDQFERF